MGNEIYTVTLPDIGEGVVEGEVIEWLKKIGEPVKQDEPIVIVMTDKATVELPAPYPGVLDKQYYSVGQIAIKDKPLYDIRLEAAIEKSAAKKIPEAPLPSEESKRPSSSLECVSKSSVEKPNTAEKIPTKESSTETVLASPKVRGLAKELGIDISKVTGTDKGGRVRIEDLKRHCSEGTRENKVLTPILQLEGDEEQPLIGIRGLMAKKMAESHAHIPQFSYFEQAEATHLIQLRQNFKEKAASEGIQLSYMPFIIRALSLTIKRFPLINSSVDVVNNKVVVHKKYNIGIAIASPQGLIVPVLKDVQVMGIEEIIKSYEALKIKAQSGKLTSSDMKEATVTISNFGVLEGGGLWATPMINYPEVSILAVARIHKEVVVRNHEVAIRDMLPLSWSFDHRIIAGEQAVMISHHYSTLIRDPAFLL